VLVSGGGRGIGAAIAGAFAAKGARVSLLGRSRAPLEQTLDRIGGKGAVAVADVTDEKSVAEALAEARAALGPVRVLVNNAGAVETAPFARMPADLWQRMLAVNATGTFNVTRAVLGDLTEAGEGRIVNIASTAALKGYAYVSAYCAAKHAVLGLTRALALELARTAITVNAVCPGYTETDMLSRSVEKITGATGMDADEARSRLSAVNPQGRFVAPEEVAETVLWLCSEAARSITGQAIAVAGGEVM